MILLEEHAKNFYSSLLETLQSANIRFMIGGAFAFDHFTGISRDTKDIDVFCRQTDVSDILSLLKQRNYKTELTDTRWLAKIFSHDAFADLIFNANNCLSPVDDSWFIHAPYASILGKDVLLMPAEEMIWTKAYVSERDRFDGADIAHLILKCAETLDWNRLLSRFGDQWSILYIHLLYFRFIYPSQAKKIPDELFDELTKRLSQHADVPVMPQNICNGTLFSPTQYLIDVKDWGYADGRPC
jgi:hypothetical protein